MVKKDEKRLKGSQSLSTEEDVLMRKLFKSMQQEATSCEKEVQCDVNESIVAELYCTVLQELTFTIVLYCALFRTGVSQQSLSTTFYIIRTSLVLRGFFFFFLSSFFMIIDQLDNFHFFCLLYIFKVHTKKSGILMVYQNLFLQV